ncbi:DUF6371 domain-containing protein [Formosa sp. L2A11]|uniref:DUF6371 domain-containing protein n=1 Tax=Formosa sp. L2A11 TaxID=2686363 RepID=UPI00210471F6|nr:DUF6371 domain-containing protein [Formosa sp. L2A11]
MYKFCLHKSSKKHHCPECGQQRFVKYIDQETGDYLSNEVGRCDREINCGYHYPPKQYFRDHTNEKPTSLQYGKIFQNSKQLKQTKIKPSYHDPMAVKESQSNFKQNNFIQFLYSKFDGKGVNQLIQDYKIGTALHNYYGTIFWQIDEQQKVRSGKIINYTKAGRRTKYINWVHAKKLKQKQLNKFHLKQCLFGLHLLNTNQKPIAIVESEKTACIMSLLFAKYLWMATGSLNGLNEEKLKPLKNRPIILYPDLGREGVNGSPYMQWKLKKEHLNKVGFNIQISDLLEKKANHNQRLKGLDIADYFLKTLKEKPNIMIPKQEGIIQTFIQKNSAVLTLIKTFDLDKGKLLNRVGNNDSKYGN